MKSKLAFIIVLLITVSSASCRKDEKSSTIKIIFLHHSTGEVIWKGNTNSKITKIAARINNKLSAHLKRNAHIPSLFEKYNKKNDKHYVISETTFPKAAPYGWNNFPYDYYNIWVKNGGKEPFMEEPTLEMLTEEYQVIIFKHCFPVCDIQADLDTADINSDFKTLQNYRLQYLALREKLHEFPNTKFILFTGAAMVKSLVTEEEALRARNFFNWVTNDWDIPSDNIYLWDLYNLQTEGGLYFKDEYAVSPTDPHPNIQFAHKVGELLFLRIIDIIENDGSKTDLTGKAKCRLPQSRPD